MKIKAIVHPNSKKPRVEIDLIGDLHIYVKEPPLEGKANKATIIALAKYFRTSASAVVILHGYKSKQKVFEIGIN